MKKRRAFFLFSMLSFTALNSGCALFLIGAGAAGGYSISQDEIEGLPEKPFEKVWAASKEVVRRQGAPTLEDKEHGKITGIVGGSTIEINVLEVTARATRVRVKARKTKGLFPDISLAQDLYTQIIKKAG